MRLYDFGREKGVFIDWMGIEPGYGTKWGGGTLDGDCVPEGIELKVHPVFADPEPVMLPDKAWESIRLSCYLLYARSVGPGMVGWWRNFWLLKNITSR